MHTELDPATIVEATFANVAALASTIADSRKQAVDARFEMAKTEPALFAKEDLAAPPLLQRPCPRLVSNGTRGRDEPKAI